MRYLLSLLALPLFAAMALAQSEIKIGATLPLTGFGASWGTEAVQGLALATDEINAKGGINGRPVKIIPEDFGQFDLKSAASAANKFISQDHVTAILTMWSEDTQVVWPVAEAHQVPVLSIAAGAKNLTRGKPFLSRVWPSDSLLIEALLKHAKKNGLTRCAVLFEQSAYHENLASLVSEGCEKSFGTTPLSLAVTQGTTDLKPLLLKVKAANADTLFIQTSNDLVGLALKQAAALDIHATRYGPVSADDPVTKKAAGAAIEGLVFPRYTPAVASFRARYNARYGKDPMIVADAAYDALMVLSAAMKESGLDGAAIDRQLRTIHDFPGATGPITIRSDGERDAREVQILQFKQGAAQLVQ